jgi:hypothetical protein
MTKYFSIGSTGAVKKDATENGEPDAEMPDVADSDQEDFEDIENVEDTQNEVAGSTPEEQDSAMQDSANLAEFDGEIEVSMGDLSEAGIQQNPIPTNTPHSSDGPKDLPIQPQGTHRRYTGMTPRKPWLDDDEDEAATDDVRYRVLGLPSTSRGIEEKRQKSLGQDQHRSPKQHSVPIETDVRSKSRGSLWV